MTIMPLGDAVPPPWASLFWTAFERSANPMALTEIDRVVLAVNPAFVDAFGYSASDLIGRPPDFLIAPSAASRIERDWEQLRRTGELTGERELIRADRVHVRVQFAAHREVIGGRQSVLLVSLDMGGRPIRLDSTGDTRSRRLTPRELEVISEIAMGRGRHEIANDLFISESTVKTHVRNSMRKVGARSQAQLVAITLTNGMIDTAAIDRRDLG
jgi:PAS domain S-box-containing protein